MNLYHLTALSAIVKYFVLAEGLDGPTEDMTDQELEAAVSVTELQAEIFRQMRRAMEAEGIVGLN
jgi:hypothetical protein